MRRPRLLLLAAALSAPALVTATEGLVDAPPPQPFRVWPSAPPADCPFSKSDTQVRGGFTGRHAEYSGADTWYPSWASDGNLYSPWTDGVVGGDPDDIHRERASHGAKPQPVAHVRHSSFGFRASFVLWHSSCVIPHPLNPLQ